MPEVVEQKTEHTLEIVKHRLDLVSSKVDEINKKLVRYGIAPVTYQIVREWEERYNDSFGIPRKVSMIEILFSLPAPEFKIEGHEYVGTITKDRDGTLAINAVNDGENFRKYVDDFRCDHCGSKRVRKVNHIFRKDGKDVLLGSKCCKDYFGFDIARKIDKVLFAINSVGTLDEEDLYGLHRHFQTEREQEQDFRNVLFLSIMELQRRPNYISQTKAAEKDTVSTSCAISGNFSLLKDTSAQKRVVEARRELQEKVREATEKYADLAKEIVEYWRNIEVKSDFEFNICQAYTNFSTKRIGIVAWAVWKYLDNQNKIKIEKTEAGTSNHVGTVGERMAFDAVLVFVTSWDGQWGTQYLSKLKDNSGNIITYFNSLNAAEHVEIGMRVTFCAKIKDHSEYHGVKQTVVQRATKVKIIEAEVEA